MTVGSDAVEFRVRDGVVFVDTDEQVSIEFTYGYAVAPEGLRRWACVLVSQALVPLELNLGLTVGGLSSVALDDFKAAFADGGASTGLSMSSHTRTYLEEKYGRTGWVVDTR